MSTPTKALPLYDAEMLSRAQLKALHCLFHRLASNASASPQRLQTHSAALSSLSCLSATEPGEHALLLASTRLCNSANALLEPCALDSREQRLAWASGIVGREVTSLSALSVSEASSLIDALKRALGQTVTPPRSRRRPGRDQARAYGTAGRRANASNEIQLVDDATLELLDDLLVQLGWTRERLDSFLRSRVSPVSSGAIRTLPEANRVIWALKNMIRRKEARRDHNTKAVQHSSTGTPNLFSKGN